MEALLRQEDTFWKYGQSKTANIAVGIEAAKRWAGKGVLSLVNAILISIHSVWILSLTTYM